MQFYILIFAIAGFTVSQLYGQKAESKEYISRKITKLFQKDGLFSNRSTNSACAYSKIQTITIQGNGMSDTLCEEVWKNNSTTYSKNKISDFFSAGELSLFVIKPLQQITLLRQSEADGYLQAREKALHNKSIEELLHPKFIVLHSSTAKGKDTTLFCTFYYPPTKHSPNNLDSLSITIVGDKIVDMTFVLSDGVPTKKIMITVLKNSNNAKFPKRLPVKGSSEAILRYFSRLYKNYSILDNRGIQND